MNTYVKVLGILGIISVSLILFKFAHVIYGIIFFVIGVGLFIYFYLLKKSYVYPSDKVLPKYIEPNEKDTEELVVAICNDHTDWIDNYAKFYKLVTVYNKCGKVLKFKSLNVKVIETPNIGSCDYAYLSFIIDRYDRLPDFVEFTKGWIKPTREYHNCLPCKEDKKSFEQLMDFSLLYKVNKNNDIMNDKFKWYPTGHKNMKAWIKNKEFLNQELYERNICNVILGGHFGATKKQILKTPKKIWEKLRSLQKYPREEVDHFIERTWRPLLCKPYKLVIVAMFKNEAVAMREWLNHYTKEGVDHFYMIDNGSTDNWQSEVEGFPVTIYSDTEQHKQYDHYNNYFIKEVKHNSKWVMVVDLDEFMYSRKGYKNIPEYLDTLDNDINEVEVKWKMFGSNSHIEQPESIINGFVRRRKETPDVDNKVAVKSICRSMELDHFNIHTHSFNGKTSNPVPEDGYEPSNSIIILPNILSEQELRESPLHLNHYRIQSWEWFKNVKMTRGDSDTKKCDTTRNEKYFQEYNHNEIEDNELFLKKY
jgi:hypothetical protein